MKASSKLSTAQALPDFKAPFKCQAGAQGCAVLRWNKLTLQLSSPCGNSHVRQWHPSLNTGGAWDIPWAWQFIESSGKCSIGFQSTNGCIAGALFQSCIIGVVGVMACHCSWRHCVSMDLGKQMVSLCDTGGNHPHSERWDNIRMCQPACASIGETFILNRAELRSSPSFATAV